MATLNELTYNLRDIIRGGRASDDDPIKNRQLEFILGYTRNTLVKKYSKTNPNLVSNSEQDLGCVDIICVDKANCCNLKSNTKIFRTKERVPNFVSYPDTVLYVGLPDKQQGFEISSYNQTRWSQYAKYTSRLTRA